MNYFEPTQEQEQGYAEWCDSRPPHVAEVARRFRPWELFRLTTTGSRVYVLSFGEQEDGGISLTVAVRPEFNDDCIFPRDVFGINPEDLAPTDTPARDTEKEKR